MILSYMPTVQLRKSEGGRAFINKPIGFIGYTTFDRTIVVTYNDNDLINYSTTYNPINSLLHVFLASHVPAIGSVNGNEV